MKQFDFYEFTGILVPGAAVLGGLMFLFPEFLTIQSIKDFSVGGLGIFVILAYVLGHLVQAVGNGLESFWWMLFGGMPTDWVRRRPARLLTDSQLFSLEEVIGRRLGIDGIRIAETSAKDWYAITRQIYAAVAGAGRAGRIDVFNGNYGLNRGIAAALVVVLVLVIARNPSSWALIFCVFGGFLLAAYRMHRFGRHYARELFVQFLQLT